MRYGLNGYYESEIMCSLCVCASLFPPPPILNLFDQIGKNFRDLRNINLFQIHEYLDLLSLVGQERGSNSSFPGYLGRIQPHL